MIAFMHTVSKFHFAWPSKKRNLIAAVKTSFDDLYIINVASHDLVFNRWYTNKTVMIYIAIKL